MGLKNTKAFRGLRHWLVAPAVVALAVAVMTAPGAAVPAPDKPEPAAVQQGDLQQISTRVRKLIKFVEDSQLPCQTRNGVVRRLRSLNDALESGRRSAARALLIGWMDNAQSSTAAGLLSPEQGARLYSGMNSVLDQIGTGWPKKPKRTRHWQPLPTCSSDVVGYTPEAADWTSYDSMVLTYSIVGMIPKVGSFLAGLVQLFWPVDTSAPTVADIIAASVEAGLKDELNRDLGHMHSYLNSLNAAIDAWKEVCPQWETPEQWGTNQYCASSAKHTYDVWDDTHRLGFEPYRSDFQDDRYQVDLLPLFVQYETLDLAFLREGILLSEYWQLPQVGVSPVDAAVPRQQMTHHLSDDPNDVDPVSGEHRGLVYVEQVFNAGLDALDDVTNQNTWTLRNRYIREMTVGVWDTAETWRFLDPDAYPNGSQGARVPTRMLYSDTMANADKTEMNWSTYRGPANVTGPLTELEIWNQTWNDWDWGDHYKNMVEAVQSTSVPSAGPARVGRLTGDASLDTPVRIHSKGSYYFDLRSGPGPIVAVEGSTYMELGPAGQTTNVRPEWIKVTFADGSSRSSGDGNNDGVPDHVYKESEDWPLNPDTKKLEPFGYEGYVLATAMALGVDDRGWDNGGKVADSVIFGLRRADSYLPSGALISLAAGKCLHAPLWDSGTQPVINPCNAGVAQIWSYNLDTQELSVEAPPKAPLDQALNSPQRMCLTVNDDNATVSIAECSGAANQRWTFSQAISGQAPTVKSVSSGKVLDLQGGATADGTKVVLSTTQVGLSRMWRLPLAGEGPVHGLGYGRCLDIAQGTANGSAVTMWQCHQPGDVRTSQLWRYDPTTKALTAYSGTKCLQATGTAKGSGVVIWDCSGAADQQWTLNADSTIKGVQSGLYLDVADSTADGDTVTLQAASGKWNQRWSLPGQQGRAVVAIGAGKCLDVTAWADGTQAQISDCSGSAGQKWVYSPVTRELVTHSNDTPAGADKCLGVDTSGKAIIGFCSGMPEQKWILAGGDGVAQTFRNVAFENSTAVPEGKCLTLPGTGTVTAAGVKVEVQPCRNADDNAAGLLQINQQWVGP